MTYSERADVVGWCRFVWIARAFSAQRQTVLITLTRVATVVIRRNTVSARQTTLSGWRRRRCDGRCRRAIATRGTLHVCTRL